MFSFLSKITNSRIDPTSWDPSHACPAGSTAVRLAPLRTAISSKSTVSLVVDGAWSHGTVEFQVKPSDLPPTYDAAVSALTASDSKSRGAQLGDGEAFLEVQVEARWNEEELWKESEVTLHKVGQHNVELSIKTPGMSTARLASQLSFHVTFFFPPELTGLEGLRTEGAQWRTIGHPSLSSLHLTTLSISTANASVAFAASHAASTSIATVNNKISGEYHANSIKIHTNNGAVEGKYYSQGGKCDIHTTNARITATVSAREARVYNRNNSIHGEFVTSDGLVIDNSNGAIKGDFASASGEISATTTNAPIEGTFKCRSSLIAKSSNGKIDIKVILVGAGGLMGERPSTPDLLEGPSDVKRPEGPGAIVKSKISVSASTSNASVVVDIIEHPEGVELAAKAKTSNSNATIKHLAPCSASFDLSTSNSRATVATPPHHAITYTHQSTNSAQGSIQSPEKAPVSANSFEIKSSNSAVSLIVE